jgi:Mg-chelatase subunit ChlD
VGGTTALLDAIGRTICKLANVQRNTAEEYRAGKVLFVIITDGMENASREFSAEKVKAMIEEEKEKHGWEFIFLGANIDAVETAGHFGIKADRAVDYVADSKGTTLNFECISQTLTGFRAMGEVPTAPLDAIRSDREKRGGRK